MTDVTAKAAINLTRPIHQHVSEAVQAPRLISCHLGAGCSRCAIGDGQSLSITMGFTPMEGLVMATPKRPVDPGLLLHLRRQGIKPDQLGRSAQP